MNQRQLFCRLLTGWYAFSQIACAAAVKTPVYSSQTGAPSFFQSGKHYEIVLLNQPAPLRASGSELMVENGNLVLRDSNGLITQAHALQNVTAAYEISPSSSSRGKNTLKGLAIGAGVGLVAGIITGFVIANSDEQPCDDDCNLAETAGAIIGGGITLIGAGAGAGIGALLPVKSSTHPMPSAP